MSMVWQYFTKCGPTEALCSICLKQFKTGGGTTNLRAHLKIKHPSFYTDGKIAKIEVLSAEEKQDSLNTKDPQDLLSSETQIDPTPVSQTRAVKRKYTKHEAQEKAVGKVFIKDIRDTYGENTDDKYDIIGKNVAFKLRDLTPEVALVAEKLISDILYESAMGNITRQSRINIYNSPSDVLH